MMDTSSTTTAYWDSTATNSTYITGDTSASYITVTFDSTSATATSTNVYVTYTDTYELPPPPPPPPFMEQVWDQVPGFGRQGLRALENKHRTAANSAIYKERKSVPAIEFPLVGGTDIKPKRQKASFGIGKRRL